VAAVASGPGTELAPRAEPDKLRLLRELDLFRGLSEADMEAIGHATSMTRCSRGSVILSPDDPPERIHILKQGRVRLYRITADGKQLTLDLLDAGTVLGDMALLGQERISEAYAEALGEARTRLLSITETDLQLARTHAAQQSMQRGGAQFFRRRLTGSKNCALCVLASTQRYRVENLMPIHPGCDCKVEPLAGNRDPGQIIDEATLKAAHAAVAKGVGQSDAGGRAPDYRDVIITRQHGEYGPLLAVRRHEFTGPDDVPSP